jgi:hypothetical protein
LAVVAFQIPALDQIYLRILIECRPQFPGMEFSWFPAVFDGIRIGGSGACRR